MSAKMYNYRCYTRMYKDASNWNPHIFLMGVEKGIVTLKGLVVSYKVKYPSYRTTEFLTIYLRERKPYIRE